MTCASPSWPPSVNLVCWLIFLLPLLSCLVFDWKMGFDIKWTVMRAVDGSVQWLCSREAERQCRIMWLTHRALESEVLHTQTQKSGSFLKQFTSVQVLKKSIVIVIIINPLTKRVVGAPQMILQPVFSIFPCSPLPSGTCRTPGLSIPWRCLPASSSVCLVFFPLSLCLARWLLPDLMNRETWPYHCNLGLFTTVRRSSCGPLACRILARKNTSSLKTYVKEDTSTKFYEPKARSLVCLHSTSNQFYTCTEPHREHVKNVQGVCEVTRFANCLRATKIRFMSY